jgi:hypothetical protein
MISVSGEHHSLGYTDKGCPGSEMIRTERNRREELVHASASA